MNSIQNFIATRGIIFNSINEILVVSRDNILWEFPGGGCEDKSSSEMCIQEIYEETGLKTKIDHFTGVHEYCMLKDDIIARNTIFYYKCDVIDKEFLDPVWKDICFDVIKFRKFINEKEFQKINGRKSLIIVKKYPFNELKTLNGIHFGFTNYC